MELNKTAERILGWLPKEPKITYAAKASKPRWRKPVWIAVTLLGVIFLSSLIFVGARTYMRYSNPQADVTASHFEKTLNCSSASVGDIVEVNVSVYWHGYVLPEFKRQVKIIDPFPENTFQLVDGSNSAEYSGYGGGDQLKYLLKVISDSDAFKDLPKPTLYLDNKEIPLSGQSPLLEIVD